MDGGGGTDTNTQNTYMKNKKNSMTNYIPITTPTIKVNRFNKGINYHQKHFVRIYPLPSLLLFCSDLLSQ